MPLQPFEDFRLSCPLPLDLHTTVQMAHGGGGRLMRGLIEGMFLPAFNAGRPSLPHDSAVLEAGGVRLAFTTDTFVVSPLFFPGGDIGKLAVCGTVNDLAMAGAKPAWLSAAFILEEGFSLESLRRVVESMQRTAEEVGVRIVTGDTKVVDHGKGDGIFINTAGIGLVPSGLDISPGRVVPGDAVLVSGDLGRHGIAIMSVREGLNFEGAWTATAPPLAGLVGSLAALRRGSALPSRFDSRRLGRCFERDRRQRAWASCSKKRRFRSPHPWPERVNSWGWIRCTWPMRAGWWRWLLRMRPSVPGKSCRAIPPRPALL